jgi:4a-hydroxytetrahydrobiopterin dehydratase
MLPRYRQAEYSSRKTGGFMIETLAAKSCVACRGDVPPLARESAERFRAQIPKWHLSIDATKIERAFKFKNFKEALAFVNKVGEIAEAEGHHPDITFGWGYASIALQTHKIKGLHENDFIVAAKIDKIAEAIGPAI